MTRKKFLRNLESEIKNGVVFNINVGVLRGIEIISNGKKYVFLFGVFNFRINGESINIGEKDNIEAGNNLIKILNNKILNIVISSKKDLLISFSEDKNITVPFSNEYESWEIREGNNLLVVCLAGGELAIWDKIISTS